ncbi:MAG: hypothetical protein ACXVHB_30665 [Solirubrobacteraceae bacterium]
MLREAGVGGQGNEAERYLRLATLRYLLLRAHEWTDEVIERLLGEVRSPSPADDTMVHQILKAMRRAVRSGVPSGRCAAPTPGEAAGPR